MQPSAFAVMIPWFGMGLLVVVGAMTAVFYGLPWQTKSEAALHRENYDRQLAAILNVQEATVNNLATLTRSVAELTTSVAVLQSQVGVARRSRKAQAQ